MKVGKTRVLSVLIALNVLIFAYQSFLSPEAALGFETTYGLSMQGVGDGRWWQFITYAFLHGSILHIALNMVGLWFAGRIVEPLIGSGRFVVLYLFTAVAGGILQMILSGENMLLLGASAAVCGVIVAFTAMFPESEIMLLLFFVIPLKMRAKFVGWAVVGSSLLFTIFHVESWIGHAAHLGGAVAGYAFVRLSSFAPPSRVERMIGLR